MTDYLKKYAYAPDEDAIDRSLGVIAENVAKVTSPEVLKDCFTFMDLTTLRSNDTVASVTKLVEKVNGLKKEWPDYPMPASICVYPNFASTVREELVDSSVHVTTVASAFPSTQSFLEVKVRECELAVAQGADEVDIVLPLAHFLAGNFDAAAEEIRAMRKAIDETSAKVGRPVVLKVILETGLLVTPEAIANASFLAMEEGADFIKTSTGKVDVNATPMAAYVMCECIRHFYEKTGRMVGFKAAGGISTAQDAVCYYSIGLTLLGKAWMNKKYFRFGVSRVANSIMSAIEEKTVTYF